MTLNWSVVWEYREVFLQGLQVTLKVSSIAIVLATIIGVIAGLARLSKNRLVSAIAACYVEAIRNTPLLVQLFLIYFGVGMFVKYETEFWPAVTALAIFAGSYVAEIVRAGIQSIAKGQMEAALSLGMNYYQAMWHIILPQAFKRILPPMAGEFISLIKDSSLVSFLAITDLTYAGRKVTAATFRSFEIYVATAALYFVLTFSLSQAVRLLERRAARSD